MRIVSLSPSLTEMLILFEASRSLVGMTDHCPDLSGGIARLGSAKDLNLPLLEFVRPDLVLADSAENSPEVIRELKKKYKVHDFEVRSPSAVRDCASALGRLVQKEEEAGLFISEFQEARQKVKEQIQDKPPLQVLLLTWNNPFLTLNFDTYASRLIESCGAYNVFHAESKREFPVEIDQMIAKAPDLLLLATDPFSFKKRHIQGFRSYRHLSKIPIELVDGLLISRFGPRTLEAMDYFTQLFLKISSSRAPIL